MLRSNQGAVDTTIDQLLTMSTDNENEKIRSELEQKEELPSTVKSPRKESSKTLKSIQKWQPPMLGPLPDTFLRLPQQVSDDGIDSAYSQENSMLEDERIAMFLQNEEFMAELRWNEDFLSTLENGKEFKGLQDGAARERENGTLSFSCRFEVGEVWKPDRSRRRGSVQRKTEKYGQT